MLTDEEMAKALGYRVESRVYNRPPQIFHGRRGGHGKKMPAFTTSLDVIVGEVEKMELAWMVANDDHGYEAILRNHRSMKDSRHFDSSAPLALCHALLNYLHEKKRK